MVGSASPAAAAALPSASPAQTPAAASPRRDRPPSAAPEPWTWAVLHPVTTIAGSPAPASALEPDRGEKAWPAVVTEFHIGRAGANNLVLTGAHRCSGRHATLHRYCKEEDDAGDGVEKVERGGDPRRGRAVALLDDHSSNGTWLGEYKVKRESGVIVRDGDVLTFGPRAARPSELEYTFRITAGPAALGEQPPPATVTTAGEGSGVARGLALSNREGPAYAASVTTPEAPRELSCATTKVSASPMPPPPAALPGTGPFPAPVPAPVPQRDAPVAERTVQPLGSAQAEKNDGGRRQLPKQEEEEGAGEKAVRPGGLPCGDGGSAAAVAHEAGGPAEMSTAVGKQALETQAPASEDRAGVPGSGREIETAEDSIADRVGAGNAAMAMDDVDELAEDDMLEVTQMDVDVDASPNQGVALNTSVGPGAAPCATNAFPDDAERPTKRPRFTPEAPRATAPPAALSTLSHRELGAVIVSARQGGTPWDVLAQRFGMALGEVQARYQQASEPGSNAPSPGPSSAPTASSVGGPALGPAPAPAPTPQAGPAVFGASPRAMTMTGGSPLAAAAMTAATASPGTPSASKHWSRWTEQDDARIRELRQQGVTFKTIAEMLGRTETATKTRWQLMLSQAKGREKMLAAAAATGSTGAVAVPSPRGGGQPASHSPASGGPSAYIQPPTDPWTAASASPPATAAVSAPAPPAAANTYPPAAVTAAAASPFSGGTMPNAEMMQAFIDRAVEDALRRREASTGVGAAGTPPPASVRKTQSPEPVAVGAPNGPTSRRTTPGREDPDGAAQPQIQAPARSDTGAAASPLVEPVPAPLKGAAAAAVAAEAAAAAADVLSARADRVSAPAACTCLCHSPTGQATLRTVERILAGASPSSSSSSWEAGDDGFLERFRAANDRLQALLRQKV